MNKVKLLLALVFVVILALPAPAVLAQTPTTVSINSGNQIVLQPGGSLTGIPLDVKNIVVTSEAQGLAAFDLILNWDARVIRVDSLTESSDALGRGWSFTPGKFDNTNGTVEVVGTTTQTPYSIADITLAYLGVTAVGSVDKATTIVVTIKILVDNKFPYTEITPRAAVNAPVTISGTAAPVTLVSIALSPAAPSISSGSTAQFTAMGTYSDRSLADITDQVTWTSTNQAVASVQPKGSANPGLASGLTAGTTAITAALGVVSAGTSLTVTQIGNPSPTPSAQPTSTPAPISIPPTPVTPTSTAQPNTSVSPSTTPTGTTTPASTETASAPPPSNPGTPPPSQPVKSSTGGVNGLLIGGIVIGVVVVGAGAFLLLRRRA